MRDSAAGHGGESGRSPSRFRGSSSLALFLMPLVVVLGHLTLFPRVADLDGFYHVGHAAAYLEGSLFDTSLPWATRSIVRDYGGDLWWGFHVLLLPFAAIGDVSSAIRLSAAALTLTLGAAVWWSLRRLDIRWAGAWAALLLLAVPNVSFRMLMVRPHVVSLAAAIMLLSVLVRGRWWQILALSALVSWVHLSLFWLAPGVALAYAMSRVPVTVMTGREQPDSGVPIRQAIPAAIAGTIIGWLLRPDPLSTAALLNVQLVQLFAAQATDAPLTFATELSPVSPLQLARMSGLFAVGWLALAALAVRGLLGGGLHRLGQRRATFVIAAFAISTVFGILALVSARRAMEQWVAFGVVAAPFVLLMVRGDRSETGAEPLQTDSRGWPSSRVGLLRTVAAVGLVAHLGWFGWRHHLNVTLVAFPASTLEASARFLETNSEAGDVVFHASWDNFGPLFARNRTNVYLGGMDPIFQFAHDARSYWEYFYLSADLTTEWTCDAWPCEQGVATDTHVALTDHFGARWVVVEPRRHPRLSTYLLNDARYELALDTGPAAVFEVLHAPAGAAGRTP